MTIIHIVQCLCGLEFLLAAAEQAEGVCVQFQRKPFPRRATGFQRKLLFPRTTQIVIEDGFGGLVHRLCEPWDLHGLATKRTGQLVFWPQECEVIKGRIRHIAGVPLGPEPLGWKKPR
ncbi:cytosolic carboxypeptidase 3-like isoform X1 [Narcine bancroftii]|uniref:cytosolic carboxypeptidase 3-like isoform X1 n=1 Tax=Narcine bancroftii TaxID=1343680 RepID=UPI003831023F